MRCDKTVLELVTKVKWRAFVFFHLHWSFELVLRTWVLSHSTWVLSLCTLTLECKVTIYVILHFLSTVQSDRFQMDFLLFWIWISFFASIFSPLPEKRCSLFCPLHRLLVQVKALRVPRSSLWSELNFKIEITMTAFLALASETFVAVKDCFRTSIWTLFQSLE